MIESIFLNKKLILKHKKNHSNHFFIKIFEFLAWFTIKSCSVDFNAPWVLDTIVDDLVVVVDVLDEAAVNILDAIIG